MVKRITTPEGKTWAGRVLPLAPAQRAALKRVVARLEWHGAAEIEVIRDLDGHSGSTSGTRASRPGFTGPPVRPKLAGRAGGGGHRTTAGCRIPGRSPPRPGNSPGWWWRSLSATACPLPLAEQPPEWQIGAVGKYAAGLEPWRCPWPARKMTAQYRSQPELFPSNCGPT